MYQSNIAMSVSDSLSLHSLQETFNKLSVAYSSVNMKRDLVILINDRKNAYRPPLLYNMHVCPFKLDFGSNVDYIMTLVRIWLHLKMYQA